ncbi:MAG: WecB/TagA/CpsF family glycosyltransferase [Pirellula sp.]|jgi:N-acetylglucosaminyldiphosphoundecaprenol N-acetyl-beta-D-mannosaminyltransferase
MLRPPNEKLSRTVLLHGIPFHAFTEKKTCEEILRGMREDRGGFVITANVDHLFRSRRGESYREIMGKADLIVADGMPLVWASRLQGTPLPERVAGSSMCYSLSEALAREGRTLYLLGGNPGVAERAAKILEGRYPGLRVVGTCCPDYGFEDDPASLNRILAHLIEMQPDMVYVALGSPKQEILISQFRSSLPKAWWMGVGIGLSFVTGEVKRAPVWMHRLGMEWMHRLYQEPNRLAKRYLFYGLPFGLELFACSAWNRIRGVGYDSY